ncbi:MAG: DUF4339 domain-containing protein [Nitriliruptoraceae bacterium]|nr:DUF4339 domain-containing protein [Nitriliruptoraceae bacterium]
MSAPSAVSPARWYHLQGEDQHGPVGLVDARVLVAGGTIGPDTYVWADGMPDWLPARDVPALTPPEPMRRSLDGWG